MVGCFGDDGPVAGIGAAEDFALPAEADEASLIVEGTLGGILIGSLRPTQSVATAIGRFGADGHIVLSGEQDLV